MSIVGMGGAGFIGRRMIPLLAAAGHSITCVDIDAAGARVAFARWGDKVTVRRGDVTSSTTSSGWSRRPAPSG